MDDARTTGREGRRSLLQCRLVDEQLGEPGLIVDFRDERRALLFDLGDLQPLRPGRLLRVSHVFVTHTHMDHFAGFDALLRVVLGRQARLTFTGGPDFVAQVEHKLRAYTWNVVHRYEVELVIEAIELDVDGRGRRARFSSRRGFEREGDAPFEPSGDVMHDEPTFRVRGRFVDHGIPCLAYAVEEKATFKLRKERLQAAGLTTGPWVRVLKQAVLHGAPGDTPITLAWRDRAGEHTQTRRVDELRHLVLDELPGLRIGYVTDLRCTKENVRALDALLQGVDLLYIESVFLDADREHAVRKNHLTARQAGWIARQIGAKAVVPFHFSPRYEGREAELIEEAAREAGRAKANRAEAGWRADRG
jgi:ribonuclease Z